MQHYTLELFRKDDTRFELRVLDGADGSRRSFPLIEQAAVDTLLTLAADDYRVNAPDLAQRGQDLFAWVDRHSNGWLRGVRQQAQALALTIDVREAGLRHLPWELLHDGVQFLCADPIHLFTPLRLASERQQTWQPQKRQLGVLFMASSPEDVQPVLDFEAEESGILQATAHKPLDLQVEESGSLQGLEERLREREDSPDVIHLSGHADVREQQPVFLLEDDEGKRADATPLALARTFANSTPRVVFLSGCRTGESSQQHNMLAFSEQVVQAGVPVVLGWALPVGDVAASQAAATFYDKLATGFDIAQAVAFARQQLLENRSPYWHLLRCYVDSSVLNPLVAKGKLRLRKHDTPKQFLDAGGRVPVCARQDFIGRRRLLQRCLRSLRSGYGDAPYAEGVLLHGMGGLGKSSAAARLIDRLRNSHEAVVCYGGLDETVLVAALGKALPKAQPLLNDAQQTLEQRLRELFEPENNPYCAKPLLVVFDDFEQNIPLESRKQGKADFNPASLAVLHTVLQAIHNGGSDTRVIVTSRFDVPVPHPCRWHDENPQTLRDVDLKKKLAQLPGLQLVHGDTAANALRERAKDIAAGNPRLLEWLDAVLQAPALDANALLDKLAQEEARFREEVLISELVGAQTRAVRHTLACAALYRLPVPLAAIAVLTDSTDTAQHLQTAAKVGLVEISDSTAGKHHFVSNLLDAALADELSEAERQPLAAIASQHLYSQGESAEKLVLRSETLAQEIVRLAIDGQEQAIAVAVGDKLATYMLQHNRYREAEAVCQLVLTLGEDFRILTTLARAEQSLGRSDTRQHFERAVALLPANDEGLDEAVLREKSATLFNYGGLLIQQGQAAEALILYQEQVLPLLEKLGDVREKAVTMGKIADILQARGQLDDALNTLNETLPVYEKLGDVREKAVTERKIADILIARGQLDEGLKVLQERCIPPMEKIGAIRDVAVFQGIVADILQARGQLDDALNTLNETLPVYEKLGDVRSKAVTMGKIADILQARGQLDEALNIRENHELPVYEKLGDVREKAVTMWWIAILLWRKNPEAHRERIRELLCQAKQDFQQMRLPQADSIQKFIDSYGLSCDK